MEEWQFKDYSFNKTKQKQLIDNSYTSSPPYLYTSLFGFFNIYKPVGMTSHDVVAILRRALKIKQIGHTGTLDPFAQGVLPIAIGKATRLIEYLPDDKEYLATVQFGRSTNTYDIDGETTFESDKKVTKEEIIGKLKEFEGEIEQIPPIFSAIKVKGKKLYEYARKGEDVEIKPRKVTIYNIELKSFDEKLQQAQILIKCSKGTYIRSIANDLGEKLGCGGHLIKLIRTQAGKFRIEDSVFIENKLISCHYEEGNNLPDEVIQPICADNKKLDCFANARNDINLSTCLINPIKMLDLPIVEIEDKDLEKIRHGTAIFLNDLSSYRLNALSTFLILVYNKDKICAVGQIEEDKIKLKKVFL